MTDDTMAFLHQLRERGGEDLLKDLAEAVLRKLMDFDVDNLIGAGRYERSDEGGDRPSVQGELAKMPRGAVEKGSVR
ncbi:transposase-like protein [Rhodoblastus acidophilus]|nr:transposase [Rhodoblastus acidophilus]MCW2283821.1 transposase-like protein [Rhodoblastus acidophilus]